MEPNISDAIEQVLGVTIEEIRSPKRDADIMEARHILCYILWKHGLVEREIGIEICRHASSVHYALMRMFDLKDKTKINNVFSLIQ